MPRILYISYVECARYPSLQRDVVLKRLNVAGSCCLLRCLSLSHGEYRSSYVAPYTRAALFPSRGAVFLATMSRALVVHSSIIQEKRTGTACPVTYYQGPLYLADKFGCGLWFLSLSLGVIPSTRKKMMSDRISDGWNFFLWCQHSIFPPPPPPFSVCPFASHRIASAKSACQATSETCRAKRAV